MSSVESTREREWANIFNSTEIFRHKDEIQALINANINVNLMINHWGDGDKTALMIVSSNVYDDENSREILLRMLLNAGADVNLRTNEGVTALMYASDDDHVEATELIVRMLLDAVANVHFKDCDGSTALLLAIQHFNAHILKMLLEAGSDVNVRNNAGESVLDLIFTYNSYSSTPEFLKIDNDGIMYMLLDAGADYSKYLHIPIIKEYIKEKNIKEEKEKLTQQIEELTQKCKLLQAERDYYFYL